MMGNFLSVKPFMGTTYHTKLLIQIPTTNHHQENLKYFLSIEPRKHPSMEVPQLYKKLSDYSSQEKHHEDISPFYYIVLPSYKVSKIIISIK